MKRILLGLLAGLILGGGITWTLFKPHGEKEEAAPAAGNTGHSVERKANGAALLKLDKPTQNRIGLQTAPLQPARLNPELKVYGRVLDPAPLIALYLDQTSTQAAYEATTREHQRMKTLHAQNQNVSVRAVETAEAAAKRDQTLLEAARAKFSLALGRTTLKPDELPAFIQSLTTLQSALVQLEVPVGETLSSPPLGARITSLASAAPTTAARLLGPAPSADPATQGQGFLFLLPTNAWPAGAAVTGFLTLPGEPRSGFLLPGSAVLRHEGDTCVYLQTGEETFQRHHVLIEHPLANGWFIQEGFAAGQRVVTIGAQQLLAEEFKGADEGEH